MIESIITDVLIITGAIVWIAIPLIKLGLTPICEVELEIEVKKKPKNKGDK